MEITEEANTVVDIEPAEEAKDNEQEPMLAESTIDCIRSSTPCTPSFTCVRKCEESCVPVPNTYIPKVKLFYQWTPNDDLMFLTSPSFTSFLIG